MNPSLVLRVREWFMVGTRGFEPPWDYSHTLLRRVRMPIPPRARMVVTDSVFLFPNSLFFDVPRGDVVKSLAWFIKCSTSNILNATVLGVKELSLV